MNPLQNLDPLNKIAEAAPGSIECELKQGLEKEKADCSDNRLFQGRKAAALSGVEQILTVISVIFYPFVRERTRRRLGVLHVIQQISFKPLGFLIRACERL